MSDYNKVLDDAWVKESSIQKFKNLDCAIFDCDGTLVDITESYNACIRHTTGFMLERMLGGKQWYDLVTEEVILKFRISGGFNNDVDTTYASILAAVASNAEDVELARKFVLNISTHADERGIVSIEEYLSGVGFMDTVKKVKGELQYPGLTGVSMLSTAFDEFFYGKGLFKKMYGAELAFNSSHGFIERDKVVISSECAEKMYSMFNGKTAIVSGRGKLATEYSLKPLLQYFDLDACVFIEDEEKEVAKSNLPVQVKKPYPYALTKSMKALNANSALCIGDSVEDMLMARKVTDASNVATVFCGVYGAVSDRGLQLKVFMDRKADAILKNINTLPHLLASLH